MMQLAMSNIAWLPEERLQAYALMAEAGVSGLEMAPGLFFFAAADAFDPEPDVARTALDEIRAHGLTLVSMQSLLFGVEGAALFGEAEARQRLVHGMDRAIALAGRLAIPNLVFGSPQQRRVPEGLAMADAMEEAAELFRGLGDKAQHEGTAIAMEPNPAAYGTNFLNRLEEASAFVARVDHPAVRLNLDLGAMHMNGEYEGTAGRVAALLPQLNHVHVSEAGLAPAPASAEALAPVLAALSAAGYGRAVSIEMKRPPEGLEAVAGSLARLRAAHRLEVEA